jgi:PilZ domain
VSTLGQDDITGRKELLLPEPPRTVEMLAEAGGALRIELISRNGLEYRARAPRLRVRPKATLQARVDAVDGGGYDVDMLVADIEPETKWTVIVRLRVTAMHARSARRVTQRVRVGERTPLYAMACRAVEAGEQFEVELSDLSTSGLAFATDREFHPGDLVALMPLVDGQPMRLRGRVLRSEPIDEALALVGCEITAITETNRERIARLASTVPDRSADRVA